MADPTTNNLSLILMATGTAAGAWGAILNASMISIVDQALGDTTTVAVSSSDVHLTTGQRQNLAFKLTGTLSNSLNVTLPLNPNSTTVAVGGFFIFDNQATGAFAVTVKTVASGSTGVEIPQGVRSLLYSDGTSVTFADEAQNQTITYNGDPNGNVAGQAGSASTRASRVINRATNEEYLCTTSGTASAAAWVKNLPYAFPAEGYLTASSDANNPVLASDSIGATTLYYTAFRGDQVFLYNGISFAPATIPGGQVTLALSSSAQAANGIYDVLGFMSSTSVFRIGFSPAWSNPTAGSGERGTGAGTPQFTRLKGIPVNAVQQTVNNGADSFTVAANRGTILGSVFIDASAGQVTCHRTYGQSRKFGVWNAYNRQTISLNGGDPNTSWPPAAPSVTYPTFTLSNGSAANRVTSFCGLAEEIVESTLTEGVSFSPGPSAYVGIGVNATSTPSGTISLIGAAGTSVNGQMPLAMTNIQPQIGINNIYSLEAFANSSLLSFFGTNSRMRLTAQWEG